MQIHGELKRAQLEILAADPSGAANLVLGRILINSTDGRAKMADGTKTKELLLNDDKINIGTSVTLADNVRIHRAGVSLLQFVTANDATAEGTLSTNTAKLSFQFESYTTAGRPANGKVGRVIFDTDLNVLLVDDGTNWVSTANGTEITNCAINLGTASNTNYLKVSSDTKANLEALTRKQGAIYYATDEDKYYGDDGLNLVELGSGGAGGINYTKNPDAESNADDHTAYKDAAQEVPEDGVGGSPTLAVARSTVSPLDGAASFEITKPASNTQGEGINVANEDFAEADRGKIQIMSFEYDASHVNYNDGDFRVYFKDETNGNVYRVNGEDVAGGKGTHYARVQVPIDCANGSLLIHCAASHSDAFTFKYDRVSFGPQKIAYGTYSTPFRPFDLVATNGITLGNAVVNSSYKVLDDEIKLYIKITLGSTSSITGDMRFNLPNGFSINTDVTGALSTSAPFGMAKFLDSGNEILNASVIGTNVSNQQFIIRHAKANGQPSGDGIRDNITGASEPFSWATNDQIVINATFPINEGFNQAQLSQDFGGRPVYLKAAGTNSNCGTTGDGSPITFTSTQDVQGLTFDGTTITIQESGWYLCKVRTESASTTGSNNFIANMMRVGVGVLDRIYDHRNKMFDTLNSRKTGTGVAVEYLEKGWDIEINALDPDGTNLDAAELFLYKLGSFGSAQILGTEFVGCHYSSDSGQAIPTALGTNLLLEDELYDTHNMYDPVTGILTIPHTGKYAFSVNLTANPTDFLSNGTFFQALLNKVGVGYVGDMGFLKAPASGGNITEPRINGYVELDLVKDDQLEVEFRENSTDGMNLNTQGFRNYMTVQRID